MCVNNFEIFILIPVRLKFFPALTRRRNYPCSRTRRFATYPVDREFIGTEVPGAEATRARLLGRANLETLFLLVENNVLRSSTLVRAYISRFMLLAGEGRASFWRFLSRSDNSVLSSPKKGSHARTMVFRSQRSVMFFQRRRHPPCSLSTSPFSISPSYDLNSLDHIFAMFRPSNFRPPPTLPFPFYYFSSFFLATSAGTLVPLPAHRGRSTACRTPSTP